mmetsp:Transcript_4051/g.9585  ORF Transcript_4051/g.9585 Transcript_4051/m.9585 type:complete len:212 (-) Transcript_4051:706-1341(-)
MQNPGSASGPLSSGDRLWSPVMHAPDLQIASDAHGAPRKRLPHWPEMQPSEEEHRQSNAQVSPSSNPLQIVPQHLPLRQSECAVHMLPGLPSVCCPSAPSMTPLCNPLSSSSSSSAFISTPDTTPTVVASSSSEDEDDAHGSASTILQSSKDWSRAMSVSMPARRRFAPAQRENCGPHMRSSHMRQALSSMDPSEEVLLWLSPNATDFMHV